MTPPKTALGFFWRGATVDSASKRLLDGPFTESSDDPELRFSLHKLLFVGYAVQPAVQIGAEHGASNRIERRSGVPLSLLLWRFDCCGQAGDHLRQLRRVAPDSPRGATNRLAEARPSNCGLRVVVVVHLRLGSPDPPGVDFVQSTEFEKRGLAQLALGLSILENRRMRIDPIALLSSAAMTARKVGVLCVLQDEEKGSIRHRGDSK
jgi:hypothetical protein